MRPICCASLHKSSGNFDIKVDHSVNSALTLSFMYFTRSWRPQPLGSQSQPPGYFPQTSAFICPAALPLQQLSYRPDREQPLWF